MSIAQIHRSNNALSPLPEVLTSYLWSLVYLEYPLQIFTLIPNHLGGGEIQDVIHQYGVSEPTHRHRLFGFTPVSGTVLVERQGNDLVMRWN